MKTYAHLWQYFAEVFLKWDMFHMKFVEKMKAYILSSKPFFLKIWKMW